MEELEALLLENQFREKTPEQKIREGEEWRKIESDKAKQRQKELAGYRPNIHPDLQPNLAEGKGQSRDKVAELVGMGRTNYEKAAKVVAYADTLKEQGKIEEGEALLKVINTQSVDAASKVLNLSEPEQVAVLETIAKGKANKVKDAVTAVRKQEKEQAVKSLLQVDSLPAPIIKETRVEQGQLWQMGRHLIYCGDSSSQEFINLACTHNATFAFADPPYNAGARAIAPTNGPLLTRGC